MFKIFHCIQFKETNKLWGEFSSPKLNTHPLKLNAIPLMYKLFIVFFEKATIWLSNEGSPVSTPPTTSYSS